MIPRARNGGERPPHPPRHLPDSSLIARLPRGLAGTSRVREAALLFFGGRDLGGEKLAPPKWTLGGGMISGGPPVVAA